jgi:hypothetical protein
MSVGSFNGEVFTKSSGRFATYPSIARFHIIGTHAVAPCPSRSISNSRVRTMRSASLRQPA